MHIAWEKECRNHGGTGEKKPRLTALIVNSQNGGGLGKDVSVERLATIEERFLLTRASGMRAFHQGLFWESVSRKLNLLRLNPEARASLETEISKKVPKPDEEWALWGVTCIPRYDP